MSGTYTPKLLAEGQLAATKGTLYTVLTANALFPKQFTAFNTSANAQTVIIYAKPGSTSREIGRAVLAQNELLVLGPAEIPNLEAGDLIEGVTTSASVVNYTLSGVLET